MIEFQNEIDREFAFEDSSMDEPYAAALRFVLDHEGGKVDDPHDPGGRTNQGVTQATYDKWRKDQGLPLRDVYLMESHERDTIYQTGYWDTVSGGELPNAIAIFAMDSAVQHGPKRARSLLQTALGVTADGVIGPVTMGAINGANTRHLLQEYAARRMDYYGNLGHFDRYGLGWSRRLVDCYSLAFQWL